MPDTPAVRLRVAVRRGRILVDTGDLAAQYRHRAQAYRDRADYLVAELADPDSPADEADVGIVPTFDEALACRMVAEELEQRADALDALG